MKNPLIKTALAITALSPLLVNAADLEDIDLASMPNTFSNGEPANADEVNANFEYLRNNMAILVELLQEQKAISSAASRYSGTFSVTGLELTIDSCDGAPQVNQSIISGTATAANGQLSFSTTQTRYVLRNSHLDDASSDVSPEDLGADQFALAFDANGRFTDVSGAISLDGNSFTLVNDNLESEDCTSAFITYFSGVRTN